MGGGAVATPPEHFSKFIPSESNFDIFWANSTFRNFNVIIIILLLLFSPQDMTMAYVTKMKVSTVIIIILAI